MRYSQIVRADAESGKHPVAMCKLLERQLNECGAFSNPPPSFQFLFVLHVKFKVVHSFDEILWHEGLFRQLVYT